MKWSHGLHQGLELKHGLEMTPESLKAIFLSNYSFFRQYGDRLCGLTGTLGSKSEHSYIKSLYNLDVVKIPRASGEKYIQKSPVVVNDYDAWQKAIMKEVAQQKAAGRATLVVCETIEDVENLCDSLNKDKMHAHSYTSSRQRLVFLDPDKPRAVEPGDIIVATNLAGRGTDFKTSAALENAGGLHVVLAYMPSNLMCPLKIEPS